MAMAERAPPMPIPSMSSTSTSPRAANSGVALALEGQDRATTSSVTDHNGDPPDLDGQTWVLLNTFAGDGRTTPMNTVRISSPSFISSSDFSARAYVSGLFWPALALSH